MSHTRTLRAIETRYKGYRFRSRLEARYAVLFDVLGLRWEYEPEGFETASGRYLPDFRLPDLLVYAEVKPDSERGLSETSDERHFAFVRDVAPLLILFGPPIVDGYALLGACEHGTLQAGAIDLAFSAEKGRIVEWCSEHGTHARTRFDAGVEAARSARFEHGARG